MIRIISRKEGFRRCGIAHSAAPKDYPDDRFTKKQLDELKAESMLIVQELPGDPETGDAGKPDGKAAGKKVK